MDSVFTELIHFFYKHLKHFLRNAEGGSEVISLQFINSY